MYFPLSVNVCRVLHVLIDFLNLFSLQPPNDPHGITREELVQALRAVLTGTPNFAEVSESIIYLWVFFFFQTSFTFSVLELFLLNEGPLR